ncbi:MAG: hypothetical protein GQ548_03850 [Methylophaga sp.]|nr:hypothetical protein [Methylophaga sp.]
MSKKIVQIAEHGEALSAYLNDMLFEEPSNNVASDNTLDTTPLDIEQSVSQLDALDKDWKESPFQTLLFDLHGLQLAIPLHELNGILTWPEKGLPKIAGKPNWHLGLFSQEHRHTEVVDTAHIIIPTQHQDTTAKFNFIILIADGKWGLACNKVNKVVTLSPDEVRWRQQAGKRPWLAGTVLEQMCSILDINELIKQLET